jgi:flagellum-specific peptidoglycan hydrolase FlgJ
MYSQCEKKTLLLLLSLFFLVIANAQKSYIKKYKPLSDSLAIEYKIPTSVILAIAIIESSSGTSRNAKLLNNHFGIVGKNSLLKTRGIKSRYKEYKTDTLSFVDFCKLIKRKKFYHQLKNNPDPKLWVTAISKSGYSELPEIWRKRILETISKNKL